MAYVRWPTLHAPRRAPSAFGDDAEITDAEWKRRMLAAQEGFVTEAQRFRAQDKTARVVQISATLMIPLAAAVWRFLLNRRSIGTGTE